MRKKKKNIYIYIERERERVFFLPVHCQCEQKRSEERSVLARPVATGGKEDEKMGAQH